MSKSFGYKPTVGTDPALELTKRELFAAVALLLPDTTIHESVIMADRLISVLNETAKRDQS